MLSPSALLWTQIAAAVLLLLSVLSLRSLIKTLRDKSNVEWSMTQGKVTVSQAGASSTHPALHQSFRSATRPSRAPTRPMARGCVPPGSGSG